MSNDPYRAGYVSQPGLTETGINTDPRPDDVPYDDLAPGAQVPSRGFTGDDEIDYLADKSRRRGTILGGNYDVPQ